MCFNLWLAVRDGNYWRRQLFTMLLEDEGQHFSINGLLFLKGIILQYNSNTIWLVYD